MKKYLVQIKYIRDKLSTMSHAQKSINFNSESPECQTFQISCGISKFENRIRLAWV